MTTITIDRAVVEQALEFCETVHGGCTDSDDGTVEAITVWCPELIDALRAALAQPIDIEAEADRRGRVLAAEMRAALAQPKPEPVAGVVLNSEGLAALVEHGREEWHCAHRGARRLYLAPPQRKPLPRRDQHSVYVPGYGLVSVKLARAVERAHGIIETEIKEDKA